MTDDTTITHDETTDAGSVAPVRWLRAIGS